MLVALIDAPVKKAKPTEALANNGKEPRADSGQTAARADSHTTTTTTTTTRTFYLPF